MSDLEQKVRYYRLVERGENFVRRAGTISARNAKSWQNACSKWLRSNLPDSGLCEDVILVSPPRIGLRGRGLFTNEVRNIQRILKVLYRARELLPFLGDSI